MQPDSERKGSDLRTDCASLRQAEECPAGWIRPEENLAGGQVPAHRVLNAKGC